MNFTETMGQLKKFGTAQNVKIYKRHGAGDNLFGVSFANLRTLQKKIKTDHELAMKLWDTGNMDAQTLATMIVDPSKFTATNANTWIAGVKYYMVADLIAGVVARTDFGLKKAEQWMTDKKEQVRQAGYSTLSAMLRDGVDVPESTCKKILERIEKEIHASPNRARHAMNMALIAIAIYRPSLKDDALAAAKRIGKVEVDHGETSCKTPDAADYIAKALSREKPTRRRAHC